MSPNWSDPVTKRTSRVSGPGKIGYSEPEVEVLGSGRTCKVRRPVFVPGFFVSRFPYVVEREFLCGVSEGIMWKRVSVPVWGNVPSDPFTLDVKPVVRSDFSGTEFLRSSLDTSEMVFL